jgi:Transcriptional activator, adenine-specific DNA methyltransferase
MSDLVLARIDSARLALEKAKSLQEIKHVGAMADAARVYAKQVGATTEVINHAGEIKLRSQRKLGACIAAAPKNAGARGVGKSGVPNRNPTLQEAGITKKQSSQAQAIASVPAKHFEAAIEEAKSTGELFPNRVAAGLIRISHCSETQKHLDKSASSLPDTPTGKFDVLVIDPPWPMRTIDRDERPNQAGLNYQTLYVYEIEALDLVSRFSAPDVHVFLWVTHRFLPEAFKILTAWRLNYGFCMVWHKPGGFQPVGLPQFNCEFCLYARRGKPVFVSTKAFPVCFTAPRGKHSEKPEEFYDVIRRVTAGRRLDAFNRRKIEGFIGWGNESPK